MSVAATIDERRVAKSEWGDIVIKVRMTKAKDIDERKVAAVHNVVEQSLDEIEEAITGQKPLPYEDGEKPKPLSVVKGQAKLPLGASTTPGKKRGRPVAGPAKG